ncbi:MAG: D-glycerate dehydrogenase [Alphaproteobacteria bacterium]|nr:D-glycerate dehydrogenase [Alphaproteobacteria bacterium]
MSKKPTVLVTRKLPDAVEARLRRDYDARLNADDRVILGPELVAQSPEVDALLVCPTDKVDAGVIDALDKRVRCISTYSVGFDHVSVPAAQRRGIQVTNTPDVLTEATADIAMLCMLGAARRAHEAQTQLREGGWKRWTPVEFRGAHLAGQRLGIVGMGKIGKAVARRAFGFGMKILYNDVVKVPADFPIPATYVAALDDLIAQSDVLTLHAPGVAENTNLLSRARIAKLPKGAVVVNTARGNLVEDDALIDALESGHVAGAGLDVFAGEPALNKRYLSAPNAYLLPHIGSATYETRDAMGFRALDNLDDFFAGRTPRDTVIR